jgi:hypothetical protein
MQLGPVHDHPLLGLVLGLVRGEGRTGHGERDLLAPFGVGGLDTDLSLPRTPWAEKW